MARKKARPISFFTVLIVIVAVVSAFWLFGENNDYEELTPIRTEDENLLSANNRINILLIGTDIDDISADEGGRADTIMIVSLDMLNYKVNILSIPRDTYLEIPGYRMDKINHSYHYGGIDLIKQTIVDFLNIPLDYYLITNFSGFEQIVDILGGVEIDVEKNMYHHTYDGLIDIDKGLQVLDGEKALQYVRFRSDALGDISRSERQRKFMIALFDKMKSPGTVLKLPQLVIQFLEMTRTDLNMSQMLQLVKLMKKIDTININADVLPGDFMNKNGISYWKPRQDEVEALVIEYFSEPVLEVETENTEDQSITE